MTIHAKARAFERYGLALSDEDMNAALAAVKAGRATFVFDQNDRNVVYDIVIAGTRCRFVYDKITQRIVTFLPARAFAKHGANFHRKSQPSPRRSSCPQYPQKKTKQEP